MGQVVEPAKAGAHGFDASTTISRAKAIALKQAGFAFAIRYLTRKAAPPPGDLSKAEVAAILDAGLALMAVQHVESVTSWVPTPAKGIEYGANAAAHAKAVNLPAGTAVFVDLEGVSPAVPPADIIAYCNNWHAQVQAAGYAPGIYVGANCGLSSDQLYHQLKMKYYWKSGSHVPPIPYRGYCMVQTIIQNDVVAGIGIDRDVITPDAFGVTPPWTRNAVEAATTLASAGTAPAAATGGDGVLRKLAAAAGVSPAMERLLVWRAQHRPTSNPRYWAVLNFDLHSASPRLFVFDRVGNATAAYLCAHGKGSEGPSDDGFATIFSNVDGSNCSSLGVYSCADTYIGKHGRSLYLDGLEATNANVRHRHIVIHWAAYVSPATIAKYGRIGRSEGCPAVEKQHVTAVIDALQGGSLMIAWKS